MKEMDWWPCLNSKITGSYQIQILNYPNIHVHILYYIGGGGGGRNKCCENLWPNPIAAIIGNKICLKLTANIVEPFLFDRLVSANP